MKSKKIFLLFCIASAFLFCSCVDIVQSVDFENGKYNFNVRIVFSKALLAMADQSVEELSKEFDFNDMPGELKNALEIIDTEYDYGFSFKFSIDPNTKDENEKKLLPKILKNGKMQVPLFFVDEFDSPMNLGDSEAEAVAQAILSSAKWRVFLSQKIVQQISAAALATKYGTKNLSFFEIGNSHCVEIPFPEIKNGAMLLLEK